MGVTPLRAVRIPDELWGRLKRKAQKDGEDASSVIRRLVQQYLDGK